MDEKHEVGEDAGVIHAVNSLKIDEILKRLPRLRDSVKLGNEKETDDRIREQLKSVKIQFNKIPIDVNSDNIFTFGTLLKKYESGKYVGSTDDDIIIQRLTDKIPDKLRKKRDDELNIVVMGEERCGKSTVLNMLFQEYLCPAQEGPDAATTGLKLYEFARYKGYQINLIDSEGVSFHNFDGLFKSISKALNLIKVNLFIFVWNYQKAIDVSFVRVLGFFKNYLPEINKYLIVCINKCPSKKTSDQIMGDFHRAFNRLNISFDLNHTNLLLVNTEFENFDRVLISNILCELAFSNRGENLIESHCSGYISSQIKSKCVIS